MYKWGCYNTMVLRKWKYPCIDGKSKLLVAWQSEWMHPPQPPLEWRRGEVWGITTRLYCNQRINIITTTSPIATSIRQKRGLHNYLQYKKHQFPLERIVKIHQTNPLAIKVFPFATE